MRPIECTCDLVMIVLEGASLEEARIGNVARDRREPALMRAPPARPGPAQFGYRKVRYRGIAKNGAQVVTLLALANLYLARGRLASA